MNVLNLYIQIRMLMLHVQDQANSLIKDACTWLEHHADQMTHASLHSLRGLDVQIAQKFKAKGTQHAVLHDLEEWVDGYESIARLRRELPVFSKPHDYEGCTLEFCQLCIEKVGVYTVDEVIDMSIERREWTGGGRHYV